MGESGRIEVAPGHPHVVRVIAPNPSPMTLAGTNTYLVAEEESVWVVDPGPRHEEHLETIRAEAEARGGIRGVVLTHSHSDHSEAAHSLGAPVVVGEAGEGDESQAFAVAARTVPTSVHPSDEMAHGSALETTVGSMDVVPTPGHAHDHVVLVAGAVCICGDLVLGEGSSIVPPRSHGGSLTAYLQSLERLASLDVELLAPGHGPWITDPAAKISQYIAHRMEREQKLVAALEAGERKRERLLDLAWDDVPALMRPAAALALEAHLEKLADEGRLPSGFAEAGSTLRG
jgi:glyoxylase-like metal-dependent hydrolase (beta-lactamase superfamily II)